MSENALVVEASAYHLVVAERDRLKEALEWIQHQCGVATVDDAVRAMNEAYEAARAALSSTGGRGRP